MIIPVSHPYLRYEAGKFFFPFSLFNFYNHVQNHIQTHIQNLDYNIYQNQNFNSATIGYLKTLTKYDTYEIYVDLDLSKVEEAHTPEFVPTDLINLWALHTLDSASDRHSIDYGWIPYDKYEVAQGRTSSRHTTDSDMDGGRRPGHDTRQRNRELKKKDPIVPKPRKKKNRQESPPRRLEFSGEMQQQQQQQQQQQIQEQQQHHQQQQQHQQLALSTASFDPQGSPHYFPGTPILIPHQTLFPQQTQFPGYPGYPQQEQSFVEMMRQTTGSHNFQNPQTSDDQYALVACSGAGPSAGGANADSDSDYEQEHEHEEHGEEEDRTYENVHDEHEEAEEQEEREEQPRRRR